MSDIAALVSDHLDIWTAATERKNGAGRGGGKRISLYGIERLRTLILDLAVLGRLVPQHKGDESATVLLKATAAARLAAVQSGKARKPKPTTELPNDLPELPRGWCWTQLSELAEISPSNASDDDVEASFVPMALVTSSIAGEHDFEVRNWGEIKKGFTHFADGDVALAKITPCFENGKAAILQGLRNGIGAGTTELHVARPWFPELNRRFLLLTMKTGTYLRNGEAKMTGTAGQKRITRSYFEATPLPLPPLAEQGRIVAKVDELMALCDALEGESAAALAAHQTLVETLLATLVNSADAADLAANWTRLEAHFDALFTTEASVDALKQTILELAVRGRLVAQAKDDEPAAQLARQLRKAIPKAKLHPPVSQEEVPFKLPEGWIWERFDHLIQPEKPIAYGVLVPGNDEPDGVPFVRIADLSITDPAHLPEKAISRDVDAQFLRTRLEGGEILMGVVGSVGKLGIAPASWAGANIARAICRIVPAEQMNRAYLIWLLQSKYMQGKFKGDTRTLAQPTLNIKLIRLAPTPVPPAAEQERILAKVDDLMAICDSLKARVAVAGEIQMRLADAIVERAA